MGLQSVVDNKKKGSFTFGAAVTALTEVNELIGLIKRNKAMQWTKVIQKRTNLLRKYKRWLSKGKIDQETYDAAKADLTTSKLKEIFNS